MEKMTKKNALAYVLNTYDLPEDVRAKLSGMVESLEKASARKSSADRKPTKAQRENAIIRQELVRALVEAGTPTTAGALATEAGYSTQKVSALLKQAIAEGQVTREIVKGKALYSATPEAEG